MKIGSVRLGYANNSSSTHSILWKCLNKSVPTSCPSEYGWEKFLLKDKKTKMEYLAAQVFANLPTELSFEYKISIVEGLLGVSPQKYNMDDNHFSGIMENGKTYGYIDHQSVWSLPYQFDSYQLHPLFIKELTEFLMQEEVSIGGGNDNCSENIFDAEKEVLESLPRDSNRKLIAKKDGDWWILFNRFNGFKMRLSFKDEPKEYTCSSVPELVDVKITNYCPHECPFCYQGSDKKGKHSDVSPYKIAQEFARKEIFEVAIGGGEPTEHPNFIEWLREFHENHVVANFTSKNMSWAKNEDIANAVEKYAGSFAISANSYGSASLIEEIKAWNEKVVKKHERHPDHATIGTLQIPLGTYGYYKSDICMCIKENVPFTLLGYKNVGRGAKFKAIDYSDILDIIKNENDLYSFGADTIFVKQFEKELLEIGVEPILFIGGEGTFSCYVDLVEGTVCESSYSGVPKKYKDEITMFNKFPYHKGEK